MKFFRTLSIFLAVFALLSQMNLASAADRGVFKNKSETRHELTSLEQKKMDAEFKHRFSSTKPGAFQKLNNNPWAAKKARQDGHSSKMLKLSDSWGSCREYAYKQRGQCYKRGGDAYTCERFYDARVKNCDQRF